MQQRNIGIDILKFFTGLLITNSHMELLYGKYNAFATGGAIGDVLFFFYFSEGWEDSITGINEESIEFIPQSLHEPY